MNFFKRLKLWLMRDKNVKKKDNKYPYVKIENGEVVYVFENEEPEKVSQVEEEHPPDPDEVPSSPSPKWFRIVLVLLLIAMIPLTYKMYREVAIQSKEEIVLQEIYASKATPSSVEKDSDKKPDEANTVDEKSSDEESSTADKIIQAANDWKDDLKGSFTSGDKGKPQSGLTSKPQNDEMLMKIRLEDENATIFLQQVRDISILYIQGETSRGQYLLRLQSMELKLNRYGERVQVLKNSDSVKHQDYIEYILLKKNAVSELINELQSAPTSDVAQIFNNAVDFHNELSAESDELFIEKLKQMGYKTSIKEGTISYQ